jgi:hypothetical protein
VFTKLNPQTADLEQVAAYSSALVISITRVD